MNPAYASINNGVFLCEICAQVHRTFGDHISCIRSISNDIWDDTMLRYMRYGTNDKFKAFIESYLLMDKPVEQRYKSMAAAYYREKVIFWQEISLKLL